MVTLKAGFSPNPRLGPLAAGECPIEGVQLEWGKVENAGVLFTQQVDHNLYDLFEFSIADFLVLRSKPAFAHLDWVAMPIFLSKPLPLLVNFCAHAAAGVQGFADLGGKRIGAPDFGMTAAVWSRVILRCLFNIDLRTTTWYNSRKPRYGQISPERQAASGMKVVYLETEDVLNQLIHRGEVDAAMGGAAGANIDVSGPVRRFSSPAVVLDLMAQLHSQEGVSPVNHLLAIKREHLATDPDLARRLYEAFERSKQLSYEQAKRAAESYLLFPALDFARQAARVGEDPFPSGIAANRAMLSRVIEQLHLDGLIETPPDIDGIFAAAVRGT